MDELLELPRDVTPTSFFETLQRALTQQPVPEGAGGHTVQVRLDGDGGGTWRLVAEADGLHVLDGATTSPFLQITLSVEDWRELVAGRVRDAVRERAGTALISPERLAELPGAHERLDRVGELRGDVRVYVEDPEQQRDYAVQYTLGGQEPNLEAPTTTVRLTLEDLAMLVAGEQPIQQAFFEGRLRIEGDMNLAMGLMNALRSE